MKNKYILLNLILLLLVSTKGFASIVSFDQLATSADLTTTKYNLDHNTIYTDYNGSIQSANLAADTVAEVDMADDANPRIRTYEGAACEFTYTGHQPATDSDLTSDISAGTSYPRGFRCVTSATSRTYTASRWTFVDIDQNCNFQFSEVAIDAATPSVAANSIRLSRVSTDGTTIASIQDLRTLSCTSGPFTAIGSGGTGEPNLDDVFRNGTPVRRFSSAGRTTNGLAQGAFVSWEAHTTFIVTPGSLFINGEYRTVSTDLSVTQGNDNPSLGTSGLDTGAIAASTAYYVYAVADQSAVKPFSISYSTSASTPTGVTNYRYIGKLRTDANSLFVSREMITTHALDSREFITGMCVFNGAAGTLACDDSINVSSLTDNGTGLYTVTWDQDFTDASNAPVCNADTSGSDEPLICGPNTLAAGSIAMEVLGHGGTNSDGNPVIIISTGRIR